MSIHFEDALNAFTVEAFDFNYEHTRINRCLVEGVADEQYDPNYIVPDAFQCGISTLLKTHPYLMERVFDVPVDPDDLADHPLTVKGNLAVAKIEWKTIPNGGRNFCFYWGFFLPKEDELDRLADVYQRPSWRISTAWKPAI